VNVALIVKSQTSGIKLDIYDNNLTLLESETFQDLYTLNFHLQTLVKKYKISKGLMVVHDADRNRVNLALAEGDDAFFVD
jgi:hypothetical protein